MITIQEGIKLPPFKPVIFSTIREALFLVKSHLFPLSESISSTDTRLYFQAEESIVQLEEILSLREIKPGESALSHVQYIDLLQQPAKKESRFWDALHLSRIKEGYQLRNALEKAPISALLNYNIIGTPSGYANPPFMISRIDFAGIQEDFNYFLKKGKMLRNQIA